MFHEKPMSFCKEISLADKSVVAPYPLTQEPLDFSGLESPIWQGGVLLL